MATYNNTICKSLLVTMVTVPIFRQLHQSSNRVRDNGDATKPRSNGTVPGVGKSNGTVPCGRPSILRKSTDKDGTASETTSGLSSIIYSIQYRLYSYTHVTCYPGIILCSPGLRMCLYLQVQYPRPMVIVITLSGVSSQDMKIRFVTSDSETQTEKDPSSDRSQTNLLETTGPPPEQLQTEPNQTIFHLDK